MENVRLGAKAVGSIVKIKVNGAAKDFIIVHQGLPSSAYDASCNGTWLLMKDIYTTMKWDGSDTDYLNSDMTAYLNGTFISLIDADIRNAIKQVKIPYINYRDDNVMSGANGLSTKVFLLSGTGCLHRWLRQKPLLLRQLWCSPRFHSSLYSLCI